MKKAIIISIQYWNLISIFRLNLIIRESFYVYKNYSLLIINLRLIKPNKIAKPNEASLNFFIL